MNDTYEHDHVRDTGVRWPAIRLSLHGAAAVLGLLAFAFLVMELRGTESTSSAAWVLMGFLLFLLAGQVVMTIVRHDEAGQGWESEASVEDGEPSWHDAESSYAPEPSYDAGSSYAAEAAQPDEVLTLGCPACSNTFHMNESDIAGTQFHCPKCGVAGYMDE